MDLLMHASKTYAQCIPVTSLLWRKFSCIGYFYFEGEIKGLCFPYLQSILFKKQYVNLKQCRKINKETQEK